MDEKTTFVIIITLILIGVYKRSKKLRDNWNLEKEISKIEKDEIEKEANIKKQLNETDQLAIIESQKTKAELLKLNQEKATEKAEKKIELEKDKLSFINQLDKNSDGIVDIIESSDFMKLLKKHQKTIQKHDKEHKEPFTKKIVQLSNYIETKKRNIQIMFDSFKNSDVDSELFQNFKDNYHISSSYSGGYKGLSYNESLICKLLCGRGVHKDLNGIYSTLSNYEEVKNILKSNIGFADSNELTIKLDYGSIKILHKNVVNQYEFTIDWKNIDIALEKLIKNGIVAVDGDIKRNSFLSTEDQISIIKNNIHTYQLLIFNSLNMINALINEDFIVFWKIYELFDKEEVFNSNWENEVLSQLTTIGNQLNNISNKLSDIVDELNTIFKSIQDMNVKIVNEIANLSYVTDSSFQDLNQSLSEELSNINSSIDINNLLTGIQTYQMYKINKNTKHLII